MDHVAIMKKSWELLPKIINREKTVESRWYKTRRAPWNKIRKSDIIYFKDSGNPITVRATAIKVDQFEINSNNQAKEIMSNFALDDLGTKSIPVEIRKYIHDKKYAIFVYFNRIERIAPFDINKKGFGMQSAWLCTENVEKIKIHQ